MWRDQLYEYEVNPPAGVWETIAAKLDDEWADIGFRLSEYESDPPRLAWNRIAASLGMEAEESRKPSLLFPRRVNWWQATGLTAASLLVVVLTYYFFQPRTLVSEPSFLPNANLSGAFRQMPDITVSPTLTVRDTLTNRREVTAFPIRALPRDRPAPALSSPPPAVLDRRRDSWTQLIPILSQPFKMPYANSAMAATSGEGYLQISLPDGRAMRLSRKLGSFLGLLADSSSTSTPDPQQQKIRSWKQKLNDANFIPAAGNFMDLQGLLELLKESGN